MTYRLVESAYDRNVLLRLLDDGHIDVADQADLIRALCAKIDRLDVAAIQAARESSHAYREQLDRESRYRSGVGHGAG